MRGEALSSLPLSQSGAGPWRGGAAAEMDVTDEFDAGHEGGDHDGADFGSTRAFREQMARQQMQDEVGR